MCRSSRRLGTTKMHGVRSSSQERRSWYSYIPTSANKLLARWEGPYKIVRKVSSVNYQVDMSDKKKRKRIFHVNMLRKWHGGSYLAEEEGTVDDTESILEWGSGTDRVEDQPLITGEQLSAKQKAELEELLRSYADVFRNAPGKTGLTEHQILTGSATPSRQPPYRLPYAYRLDVLKELQEMEANGILEPSSSDRLPELLWCQRRMVLSDCVSTSGD